jgi:xanthine dehydrogenase accessory factor
MDDAAWFQALGRWAGSGEPFVTATVVQTSGSCPQKPGARLAFAAGAGLLGTVGGGAIEQQVLQACEALLASGEESQLLQTHLTRDLGMCCGGSMTVFLQRHAPAGRLVLFGAGHVHQAVAALARTCGFVARVVDEREDWLTAERFPHAELVLEDPAVAARRLPLGAQDWVCVATHDHALDEAVLQGLAGKPLRYLGMIGSDRKSLRIRERLQQKGLAAADIDRVQCPMGLDIGAQSPEEIAVAVVAELIRQRRAASVRTSVRTASVGPASLGTAVALVTGPT